MGKGNRTGSDNKRKYETAEDLERVADVYFAECDERGVLYGEAGLCLALGVGKLTLRSWRTGERCPDLQEAVERCFLRIQDQIETDPRYQEKGMVSRGIFLQKQPCFGGYQDRIEANTNMTVNVNMGANVDESDFK